MGTGVKVCFPVSLSLDKQSGKLNGTEGLNNFSQLAVMFGDHEGGGKSESTPGTTMRDMRLSWHNPRNYLPEGIGD